MDVSLDGEVPRLGGLVVFFIVFYRMNFSYEA